ncbi:GNAT family N-acetyltransferase [Engelhardtia mirabilis]|uniref:Putative acetyltransferase YhhY n=1 Tax=Engelhardtia mirabilis TaxID=2528011 RepID=A0A518BDQ4_9BACT|nr:putative acetyltransferase YhhY [Planctomycetes bacterium Pla133]QDU99443.1 putative acetyltransferase YhhY [Planctomycetes bacterium Pla86]
MRSCVREITEDDAEEFLGLLKQLDSETSFMLMDPGERTTSTEEQRQWIRSAVEVVNHTILVADVDGELVGFIGARGGAYHRNHHCAHLAMGVLQAYCGHGLGRSLLREVEQWARKRNLRRLELTVMVHNERAVRLYRGAGFAFEGTKREALVVDGRAIDEHAMAKLLPPPEAAEFALGRPFS